MNYSTACQYCNFLWVHKKAGSTQHAMWTVPFSEFRRRAASLALLMAQHTVEFQFPQPFLHGSPEKWASFTWDEQCFLHQCFSSTAVHWWIHGTKEERKQSSAIFSWTVLEPFPVNLSILLCLHPFYVVQSLGRGQDWMSIPTILTLSLFKSFSQ
jgi:hypothetical protein